MEMEEMLNKETVETVAEKAAEVVTEVAAKTKGITISKPAAIGLGAAAFVGVAGASYSIVKHGITFVKGGIKALRCKKNGAIAEPDVKAKVDGQPVDTDIVDTPKPEATEESKA